MKSKMVITLSLIGVIAILWWIWGNPTDKAIEQQGISQVEKLVQPIESAKKIVGNKTSTITKEPSRVTENSGELEVTSNENQQLFNGISRPSDEAKEILEEAGVLPEDLKGESYVEFDLDSLRSLEVGDTFNLEIPQTLEMFSAEVTKVNTFDNGDKSVFVRLVGSDGAMHTTVLTVGEDALYGQFTTASGNYVFESKGKHGWLAAKRDLYKSHVEFEAVQMDTSNDDSIEVIAPEGTKE